MQDELVTIPEDLEGYVNDYRIHVFNIAWLTDEEIDRFESDFKIVAKFFLRKRKGLGLDMEDTQVIEHVDEMMKLLSVMTKDDTYQNLDFSKYGEEDVRMCEIAQTLINEGKQQGLQQGIQQGLKQGRLENAKSMAISLHESGVAEDLIAKAANVSVDLVRSWLGLQTT